MAGVSLPEVFYFRRGETTSLSEVCGFTDTQADVITLTWINHDRDWPVFPSKVRFGGDYVSLGGANLNMWMS